MKPIGSFSPYNKKHDTGIPINGKDEAPRSQGRSDYNRIVERMSSDVNDDGKGGFLSIAQSIGCSKSSLLYWYYKYKANGSEVFNSLERNNSYSKEFKLFLAKEYSEGRSSGVDLCAKYNLSLSTLLNWVKKYYNGIENKNYFPKGEVYTMKSRKTSFKDRLEIVNWVISNNMNYKEAASKFLTNYANVYKWTKAYLKNGKEALKDKKRGPKNKKNLDEKSLSEVEKLELKLEIEISLRKQLEFELEVLKKKDELERRSLYRK